MTYYIIIAVLGVSFVAFCVLWAIFHGAAIERERQEVREIAEAHARGRK